MKKMQKFIMIITVLCSIIISTINVSAANVSESQINGAIDWARNVSFSNGYYGKSFSGMCLAFCQLAYSSQGVTVGRWGNAQNAGNNLIVSYDMNPPKGALVFFSNRNGLGHVGISLGDGTYIHAASNGKAITKLTSYNSTFAITYRGWGYPGVGNRLSTTSSGTSDNTYTAYVVNTDGSLAINSIPKAQNQIGSIPEGASVKVYPDKKVGNWCWVEYNGVSGYAYSKYLTTTAPNTNNSSSSNISAPTTTSNTWTGVIRGTDGTLVINSQPAVNHQIGLIPEGATCTVYPDKTSGNWYWVEYNGVSGYSYKSYIVPQGGNNVSNTRSGVIRGTDGTLVINSRPKAGYDIGYIPEGATCTVYPDKTSGNWYWVEYNGVSGYSYKSYIVLQ